MTRRSTTGSGRAEELVELTIRRSTAADAPAIRRLAQLEGVPPPVGEHLVAEEHGTVRAALALHGGAAIADPFHPTAELVTMLSLRAARLAPPAVDTHPRRGIVAPARRGPSPAALRPHPRLAARAGGR